MEYAGFWKRFGAYVLDFVVLAPISVLSVVLANASKSFYLYYLVPGLIISLWFHVYLVKKHGGTPGKLLMKIRIKKTDGSDVGYREAILRHSVLFLLANVMSLGFALATLRISDVEYLSLGFTDKSMTLMALAPAWLKPLQILLNIWVWSEFIVILTNKQRRAAHDFIAGTVVIVNPAIKAPAA